MTTIAVRPGQTWDYVLIEDRGNKDHATWSLASLADGDCAMLEDRLGSMEAKTGGDNTIRVNLGTHTRNVLQLGLKGVTNLKCKAEASEELEEVRFETAPKTVLDKHRKEVPTSGFLSFLDPAWRTELANAIMERQRVTEEDAKN